MENDTIKIRLKIADYTHPMTIKRAEEEMYRKAAKMVDWRYTNYKEAFKSVNDDNMILSFVSLDFALQVLKLKNDKDVELVNEKLEKLTSEIESFLVNR